MHLKSVENVITLGKLIGLLFLFGLPLLSILFLKTPKIRGMTSLARHPQIMIHCLLLSFILTLTRTKYIPYFLECFSPLNCIRLLIVFAQQSGLNVYCVRPRIVFARCSKHCARAIVIRQDNSLSGKVSIKRIVPLYG